MWQRRWLSLGAGLGRRASATEMSEGTFRRMWAKTERQFTKERQKRFGFNFGDPGDRLPFRRPERLGPAFFRCLDSRKRHQLSLLYLEALRALLPTAESVGPADRDLLRRLQITSVDIDVSAQNLKILWLVEEDSVLETEAISRRLRDVGQRLREELGRHSLLGYVPRLLFHPDISTASLQTLNLKMARADYPEDYAPAMDLGLSSSAPGRAPVTVYEVEARAEYQPTSPSRADEEPLDRDSLLRSLRPVASQRQADIDRQDYARRLATLLQKHKRSLRQGSAANPMPEE